LADVLFCIVWQLLKQKPDTACNRSGLRMDCKTARELQRQYIIILLFFKCFYEFFLISFSISIIFFLWFSFNECNRYLYFGSFVKCRNSEFAVIATFKVLLNFSRRIKSSKLSSLTFVNKYHRKKNVHPLISSLHNGLIS
jgi:hypothetical protein